MPYLAWLAQWVEHSAVNRQVAGSSPASGASLIETKNLTKEKFFGIIYIDKMIRQENCKFMTIT